MFDINEYLKLEQIGKIPNGNDLLNFFINMDKLVDTEKMENDVQTLKTLLMKVAKLYGKKLVFVVDKEHVEMFESTEDKEEEE